MPLRGLGSMDRVTNLDLSGFHGMLDSMGHRAFGGDWKNVRSGVSSWYHLNRVRGALPGMTQHSPLIRTELSGPGSSTKTSLTADIERLTFRRVITPLSSPSTEVTQGSATTTTRNRQFGEQAALGGRGGDVAGGPVLGEVIGGVTKTLRDGDRVRNQERVVVATKFDQPMAIFDGWVRLDGTMTGSKSTVHESGLFPVEIAIPLTELQGSRDHDSVLPPTFTRDHPTGFVDEPRPKPAPDPVDLTRPANPDTRTGFGHQGPRTDPRGKGLFKNLFTGSKGAVNATTPRTSSGPVRPDAIAPNRTSPVSAAKLQASAQGPDIIETREDADRRPRTVGETPAVLTDAADGTAPARRTDPPPPRLDWTPPPATKNPPLPPAHAAEESWHPSDMLLGVDPASGLLEAIRHDLAPALGSGLDHAMTGVSDQFGPHVLSARLTHESGREWSHDIPVTGGRLTVKVRPIREQQAEYVGTSKKFETDMSTESQSSTAHIHDNVLRTVAGGRLQVPIPHGSVTVQVTHSGSVRPKDTVAAVDHGAGQLTDAGGEGTTGETEERIPLRVKTVEPHDLFRQPIRFEISYEQHLGANLLRGVPEAPEPVRLHGVFSYPKHTPAATEAADGPTDGAAPHPRIEVEQVVLKVRPHPAPNPVPAPNAAPLPAPPTGGADRRTPDEDLVATHILDAMAGRGTEVFGDKWPRVRAELAPHVKTMAIQRGLGDHSRGSTRTITLTSVSGGRVVLGAHVDTMDPADSNATSEFYSGGQQVQTSGVSNTKSSNWQGYVQVQGDVLPSGDAVNLSLLGRVDGGVGKETLNTRTENSATGLLFRKKVPSLTHVGTATVEAEMSRPTGLFGLGEQRISRTGTAQVDFITRESPTDRQDHARYAPRPGIIQDGRNPHRGPNPPERGLSPHSIVRKITDGAAFRTRTLRNLRQELGRLKMSRLDGHVTKSLSDTRLERSLPAMTRDGAEVELFRHGSLRITGRADVRRLDYRTIEHEGGNANVLNEVNQIGVNQPIRARDLGLRFLLGPHWKLPGFQGTLLAGGGVNGRQRFGSSFAQAARSPPTPSSPAPTPSSTAAPGSSSPHTTAPPRMSSRVWTCTARS
ncbi:hypothetical protein GTW78_31800 [Streptomyces sp. SID4948]|nr:hypothetical protein [Streptomyces sp. SID4948]